MSNEEKIKWCQENLLGKDIHVKEIDGKFIINGNVILNDGISALPFKIDEIHGSFVTKNSITKRDGCLETLKNMPDVIFGKFDISMNPKLTTLEGGPKIVHGSYWCDNCNLTNLNGIAKQIDGSLLAFNNNISDATELMVVTIRESVFIGSNPVFEDFDNQITELRQKYGLKFE